MLEDRRRCVALGLALLLIGCGGDPPVEPRPSPPPPPPVLPPPPPAPVGEWSPSNTLTDWIFPGETYAAITWIMKPVAFPPPSLHEKGLLHYYALQFDAGSPSNAGYAGLQTDASVHNDHRREGRAINFSIWNATAYDSAHVDAITETDNFESGSARILLPYEWEVGEEYRFTIAIAEHDDGYAWRLDVNGTLVGRLIGDSTFYPADWYMLTWGEDMHWWHTYKGSRAFSCEEMEPSSMQFLGVRAVDEAGVEHAADESNSWITRDKQETVTGGNGHVTKLCDSPTVEELEDGVQHNLGYRP